MRNTDRVDLVIGDLASMDLVMVDLVSVDLVMVDLVSVNRGSLAHWIERGSYKVGVLGSIPRGSTKGVK